MKNKSLLFSIVASLFIIAFLLIINYLTSWSHLWFIYPTFAILWWPISLFFAGKKQWKGFAVVGSILISVFFVIVNMLTSPAYPWAIYPIFAVAWWPMSVILCGARRFRLYAITASIMTTLFFFIVNMVSSPQVLWFFYPAFAAFWWPISVILCGMKRYKLYAVISSVYLILFFALVNLITSPHTLWFLYIVFPILWWPLSMLFARQKTIKAYSVIMSLLTIGFLALVNILNTPDMLWFQWTIFYFLWWPVCMLLGEKAKTLTFSIISAIIIIAYFVMQYMVQTPGLHPWYLYIILPVVWWPVTTALKNIRHTKGFLLGSMIIFTLYYGILNLLLSPDYPWIIYLLFAFAWAVIGDYFANKKQFFALSIWGSSITIVFFAVVNYMSSPNYIWAVYPAFAIIWWPLCYYFFKVRKKAIPT